MIVDAKGREIEGGNGIDMTERQKAKVMAQNCTVGEANEIAAEHARNAMAYLGNQIGPFVMKAISDAIRGYHDSLIERGVIPETFPNALPVGVDVEQLIQKPIHSASDEAIVADVFGGKETVRKETVRKETVRKETVQ